MTLEQQLQTLAEIGIQLNEAITIDDLLYSWGREESEKNPFDLVLFMLGSEVEREPGGRRICDQAWNFDLERIEDDGAYVEIIENLCRVAGMPGLTTDLEDSVDLENGEA